MTTLYFDIYNLASTQIADLIKKDYETKLIPQRHRNI